MMHTFPIKSFLFFEFMFSPKKSRHHFETPDNSNGISLSKLESIKRILLCFLLLFLIFKFSVNIFLKYLLSISSVKTWLGFLANIIILGLIILPQKHCGIKLVLSSYPNISLILSILFLSFFKILFFVWSLYTTNCLKF